MNPGAGCTAATELRTTRAQHAAAHQTVASKESQGEPRRAKESQGEPLKYGVRSTEYCNTIPVAPCMAAAAGAQRLRNIKSTNALLGETTILLFP